ncbi:MAG TPA: LuxR C-terminal-related transcriptional regulator [Stellaceae bacterium]|nr:LuxR C-terminal-related transcriptional regulator [Stellaceae bacterium]
MMRTFVDQLPNGLAVQPRTVMFTGDGPLALVNADFDGDGKLDLAILNLGGATMVVCRGDGQGGFAPPDTGVVEQRRAGTAMRERLTARETEVANLLMRGYTDREMATMLGIGRRTVETHAANVRAKLGLRSRRQLLHGAWPAA